jgi:hypothetical protein
MEKVARTVLQEVLIRRGGLQKEESVSRFQFFMPPSSSAFSTDKCLMV